MSETRLVRRDELLQGDKGGGFRGRQPNACFLDAAICAGLRPADVLVYVKRSQGRENRPYQKRSTVDAKSAAFCKSYSAPKRQIKSLRYHCTTVAHSSNPLRRRKMRMNTIQSKYDKMSVVKRRTAAILKEALATP